MVKYSGDEVQACVHSIPDQVLRGRIIQQFGARDLHLFRVRWNSQLIDPAMVQIRLESERNFVEVKILPQKGL